MVESYRRIADSGTSPDKFFFVLVWCSEVSLASFLLMCLRVYVFTCYTLTKR